MIPFSLSSAVAFINKPYIKRPIQITIVVLLVLFLFNSCGDYLKPKVIKALGGYTAREVKETIDTVSIRYDSLYFKYDSVKTKVTLLTTSIKIKDYKYKQLLSSSSTKGKPSTYIPATKGDILGDSFIEIDAFLSEAYLTENDISDTLIDGKIRTIVNPATCEIIEQRLDYKPKFPIFITKTITIEKKIEETLFDKPKAHIGIGIVGTNNRYMGGTLIYQTPKKWQYQGGYMWNIDNTVIPNNSIKGVVTFQIAKLF